MGFLFTVLSCVVNAVVQICFLSSAEMEGLEVAIV